MAHREGLNGFNFDLETSGMADIGPFLKLFAARLHAAEPRVGVSYDAGAFEASGAVLDRWISMGTYTSDLGSFKAIMALSLRSRTITLLGPTRAASGVVFEG